MMPEKKGTWTMPLLVVDFLDRVIRMPECHLFSSFPCALSKLVNICVMLQIGMQKQLTVARCRQKKLFLGSLCLHVQQLCSQSIAGGQTNKYVMPGGIF
jgi:hypothetical protein